jgi:hypothetical protein
MLFTIIVTNFPWQRARNPTGNDFTVKLELIFSQSGNSIFLIDSAARQFAARLM